METERSISRFNQDVEEKQGYQYTNVHKLSSILANTRMTDEILNSADFYGKSIIDIGCGDGTYTAEIAKTGAKYVLGIDAAESAILHAKKRFDTIENLEFCWKSVYELAPTDQMFDIAIARGILHHLYNVEQAIGRICKIANTIISLEPNGYNPILKIIERYSTYHIEHEEKSYLPHNLDKWFIENGGHIKRTKYIGLVPFFCPEYLAHFLKIIEPIVETLPIVRNISCGQYVQVIMMDKIISP